MRTKLIPWLLVILFPAIISADPSPAIKNLMKEPVSIFDFGLYKIECDLNKFYSEIAANPYNVDTEVQTGYIPSANRIVIIIKAISREVKVDIKSAKKICEDHYMRLIRTLRLEKYFSKISAGYSSENGLRDEIQDITQIDIMVVSLENPFKAVAHSRNMFKEKIKFVQD
jgi:hypothetical protein